MTPALGPVYEAPVALRIAHVAYTHYASDPRVRREAEALAGRGDEVTVWALRPDEGPAAPEVEGVRIRDVVVPRYRGGQAKAYLASYARFIGEVGVQLALEHRRRPFDIVHVHTMPDVLVFAAALPRLSGAKVVLDMHDLMPDLFRAKFRLAPGSLGLRALRLAQRASTAFADAVIAVHENQYQLLLRDGVPAYKLAIVMNAADPAHFGPRKKEPRLKEGGPIRVVYHGTLLERYGLDDALDAFAKAKATQPNLQLTVIGGGDHFEALRARAHRLGLIGPDFVMDGQRRPLEEVAAAIRSAHIGLVPGRDDHEDSVLPTKLMEYAAVGIPAVASRTRTVDRFFAEDQAELVPVGDVDAMAAALLRLAGDKARRKTLTDGGRAWDAEYGWGVNRQMLFRLYDHLCAETIKAARKARQAAIEGKKTGRRPDDAPVEPTVTG